MTADPVAEALRECEDLAGDLALHACEKWQCDSCYKPLLAAIARYGDLREKAGYARGCNDVEVMDRQTIEEAARREGRLEEIERMWPRIAGSEGQWESLARWAIQERDRLRRGEGE